MCPSSKVGFEILHGCYEANNTSCWPAYTPPKSPQAPRPGPATGYHATTPPHQDLGGGTGVVPKTSQDHSWVRGLAGLTLP
ncbi:hypothetical protein KVR01_008457 [Diaporthe batatas]|uniref:uncharacterized protein n=1 Tax=Diaporthe batatas TaxID=748121 RepID=UPI001D03CCB4|nr:uncharacterized protein KVR01_008457 [Diaporthe batatas]KAG8161470.1 hypothetical protein KVR01_008457 [Diaporthe batatas]